MSSGIHHAVAGTHQRSRFRNSDNLSATDTTFSCLALGGSRDGLAPAYPLGRLNGCFSCRQESRRVGHRRYSLVCRPPHMAFDGNRGTSDPQRAYLKSKLFQSPPCPREMIGDRRRRHAPLRSSHRAAERLEAQLMLRARSPGLQASTISFAKGASARERGCAGASIEG